MEKYVAFPGLELEFYLKSIAISVGNIDIHWYGVIVTLGLVLSVIYAMTRYKTFEIAKKDDVLDAVLISVPFAFICARLYYVAFSWELYKDNLSSVFAIWEGGIAIYGGVIGGAIAFLLVSKFKKINPLSMLDLGACSLLLGQAIGRWGNFVNVEAYGSQTESVFRMVLFENIDTTVGVHPTFLYESLWNFTGFILLYLISKFVYKFKGQMILCYLAWYGLGRGFIEGLRTDSLWYGEYRVSQVLAFVTCAVSAVLLVICFAVSFKKTKKVSVSETDDIIEEKEEENNDDIA